MGDLHCPQEVCALVCGGLGPLPDSSSVLQGPCLPLFSSFLLSFRLSFTCSFARLSLSLSVGSPGFGSAALGLGPTDLLLEGLSGDSCARCERFLQEALQGSRVGNVGLVAWPEHEGRVAGSWIQHEVTEVHSCAVQLRSSSGYSYCNYYYYYYY